MTIAEPLPLVVVFALSTLNDVMQAPRHRRCGRRSRYTIVPCATLPGSDMPPKHDAVSHCGGGRDVRRMGPGGCCPSRRTGSGCSQALGLWTVSTVPAAAKAISQTPGLQTRL